MDQIQRHTVPGEGQYVGSTSYYIINQNKKNEMVKEIFGIEGPFDQDITLEAIEARVLGDQTGDGTGDEADITEVTMQAEGNDLLYGRLRGSGRFYRLCGIQ